MRIEEAPQLVKIEAQPVRVGASWLFAIRIGKRCGEDLFACRSHQARWLPGSNMYSERKE